MLKHKPSHLEDELCFAVYSTQKLYNRFYSIVLKRYGLTYVQYTTMLVLWEKQRPMMVKELGERLKLDSGTLTPLLNRLENDDYESRIRELGIKLREAVEIENYEEAARLRDMIHQLKKMDNTDDSTQGGGHDA